MSAEQKPVTPRPAASLLLVRDGEQGLEVLMTTRHAAAGFAAGALVFPGGKVDDGDRALMRYCRAPAECDDVSLLFRLAAIRETFEETGILLARRSGSAALLSRDELHRLRPDGATAKFGEVLGSETIELAGDALVPFAHWITPIDRPKRFDTHFFIAAAQGDQVAVHDGHEAVDVVWVRPDDVVKRADAREISLVFATRMNLIKLGRSRTAAEAVEAARQDRIVTVVPQMTQTPEGTMAQIPAEAGYGGSHFSLANIPLA